VKCGVDDGRYCETAARLDAGNTDGSRIDDGMMLPI
jgi:hypothetical protein